MPKKNTGKENIREFKTRFYWGNRNKYSIKRRESKESTGKK
jgi:hypothetical protein